MICRWFSPGLSAEGWLVLTVINRYDTVTKLAVNWRYVGTSSSGRFSRIESDVELDWEGRINTIRRMVDKLDSKITARADSADDAHRQLDRKLDTIITHLGARK